MIQDQNMLLELREIDEETRWNALATRDARFDGIFVFAVRSTGIYCKPSCAARRPRPEQVLFFNSGAAAESVGFRACLRCLPQKAHSPDPRTEMVKRACRLIENYTEGNPSLAALGMELGISPYHLQRTFKSITGLTPRQYWAAHRVSKFKASIKEGEVVTNALYDAGYGSSSRLYEQSDSELGMTPVAYRRGGAGMTITYSIVGCSLGRLLVAATVRGLSAVRLGDSDEELEETLFAEFHRAAIQRDDTALNSFIEPILKHLDERQASLDLPLDVLATAFQRRVWEELRRIPYGSVRSYSDVARAIGQPKAVRAVASACAANPVALVTPCHRVIRENGEMGGYRWGLERKRKLLSQEQQERTVVQSGGDGES